MDNERHEFDLKIELDLYDLVRVIQEDFRLTKEEKQKEIKEAIEQFCREYKISKKEEIDYIFDKLEALNKRQERIKEERKTKDFYEGNLGFKKNDELNNLNEQIK